MQIVRTVFWVVLTAVVVAFIALNWNAVPVNFWQFDDGTYLRFMWPVGFVALVFFLAGLVPMWLLSKAGRWRLKRRISALENTVRATAPPPLIATSTQLEAAGENAETERSTAG